MPLTMTETIGFCDNVIQFLSANQSTLQADGLDVTTWLTDLQARKELALSKNESQEAMKASLRMLTQEVNEALDAAYSTTSSRLDAAIGVLGKNSELGKQAARLRSSIRRGRRSTTPSEETT